MQELPRSESRLFLDSGRGKVIDGYFAFNKSVFRQYIVVKMMAFWLNLVNIYLKMCFTVDIN